MWGETELRKALLDLSILLTLADHDSHIHKVAALVPAWLYLLCLFGCLKVSVVSSVVFIPSLLSDDVSQVGQLQLEELTRLQWSSNESLARNLHTVQTTSCRQMSAT